MRGRKNKTRTKDQTSGVHRRKTKFVVYGEEVLEKRVKECGNTGRVYLPPNWVGKTVKIIKIA